MDRFWNSTIYFFSTMWRMSKEEFKKFGYTLLLLIAILYVIFLARLATDAYWFLVLIGFVAWLAGGAVLFKIRRLIHVTIAGETLEGFEALRDLNTPKTTDVEHTGAEFVQSPFSILFWQVSLRIFLFLTAACLVVPLLPLRNNPLFILLFPMFVVALAISFPTATRKTAEWVSFIAAILLFFVHLTLLFPAVQVKFGLDRVFGFFPSEKIAQKIQELSKLEKEQREKQAESNLDSILKKRVANPNFKPSPEEQFLVENYKNGELRSLEEIKEAEKIKKEEEQRKKQKELEESRKNFRSFRSVVFDKTDNFPNNRHPIQLEKGSYIVIPSEGTIIARGTGNEIIETVPEDEIKITNGIEWIAVASKHKKIEIMKRKRK